MGVRLRLYKNLGSARFHLRKKGEHQQGRQLTDVLI